MSMGNWLLGCTCGWMGKAAPRPGFDHEGDLNRQFVEHVPEAERRTYLLVDMRPSNVDARPAQGEFDDPEKLPIGTFVMPAGEPVAFLSWHDDDGVYIGRFKPANGPEQELPVGEYRSPEGRVFRLE